MMYKPNFKPEVYTKVEESGVKLTIRYLCNPRNRRASSQEIWEQTLIAFKKEKNIEFAYPTIRYYNNLKEQL